MNDFIKISYMMTICLCDVNSLLCQVKNESNSEESSNDSSYNVIQDVIRETTEKIYYYHNQNSESNSGSWEIRIPNSTNGRRRYDETTSTTIELSDRLHQETSSSENIEESDGTLTHYPYSVSIQRKGSHYATGALVGKRWVITTAAEFYSVRENLKLFRLRFGSVDCKRRGVVLPVKDVYLHPSYTPGSPSFDVSLIQTGKEVPLGPRIMPVALSAVTRKIIKANFLITYWPRIVIKDTILPSSAKERVKYKLMRVSTQKLLPRRDLCEKMMLDLNITLASSTLCLNPISALHSVCMPDTGAPVIASDGLWGVTSGWVSPRCPLAPAPTLFTRLTAPSVRSWLSSMLSQTGGTF